MAANFRKALQDKVLSICQLAVGDPSATNYVRTFDKYLHDLPTQNFPYVVANVRQAQRTGSGEMGTYNDMYEWAVHIYYLDIETTEGNYSVAEARRDEIVQKIVTAFEGNPRLDNLTDIATPMRYVVYDSNWESVLFDSSGQEGYYTFVSELYLSVDTARS